jgi:hypothetical protein
LGDDQRYPIVERGGEPSCDDHTEHEHSDGRNDEEARPPCYVRARLLSHHHAETLPAALLPLVTQPEHRGSLGRRR